MKVIDLLNKIANGEEVPRVKYDDIEAYIGADGYLKDNYGDNVEWWIDKNWLNTEVEIIEEDKKIEKIDLSEWAEITYQEDWEMLTKDFNRNCNLFVNKINKIIDYLEENK